MMKMNKNRTLAAAAAVTLLAGLAIPAYAAISGDYVGEAKAKAAALEHAGVTEKETSYLRVELERETVKEVVGISDTAMAETAYACAVSVVMGKSMVLKLWNKDSAEMLVQRINTLESRLKEAYSRRSETKVVTEYRTRGIVKAAAWFGLVALVVLLVFIVVKIKKMIMR